ncbi:DinB family protein [Mucilaginibacter sp.]
MDNTALLTEELLKLINGGGAHATLEDALADIPPTAIGERPYGLPYSIWQLAEHIRIAQWDMLEFSKDGSHQSPKWPDDYWPKEAAPADPEAWNQTLVQIGKDKEEFISLIQQGDLFTKIPHGQGQTLLREALQLADHNAYHTAEIIVLRRLLGCWKS